MDMLQLREKEIFETLKKIRKCKFAVIGGYAVNAYALPRFSVDCDIVIEDDSQLKEIEKELKEIGYIKEQTDFVNLPYHKEFRRYEKEIVKNFRVSVDIMIKNVSDRKTHALFTAEWVFKNSALTLLKGKTIAEKLKLRIINLDALIVMKFVSCRSTDIRDVFMLMPQAKDVKWIKEEISKRCDFNDRFARVKDKITSSQFKDNLQGVYGKVDEKIFEKHKKAILELEWRYLVKVKKQKRRLLKLKRQMMGRVR